MTAVTHEVGREPDKSALLISVIDSHPTAGEALCDGIVVTAHPDVMGYLNVFFSSTVAGVLTITRTIGAVTTTGKLNNGTSIGAGVEIAQTVEIINGETINFTFGDDGGTYKLRVGSVIQR